MGHLVARVIAKGEINSNNRKVLVLVSVPSCKKMEKQKCYLKARKVFLLTQTPTPTLITVVQ
jgi:hypothetical protein